MSAPHSLQQPMPTFQASQSVHVPNVEWLEHSAEVMSARPNNYQSRKPSDSRRSSLRSKCQFSSSPIRSNAAGPSRDNSLVEANESATWNISGAPLHRFGPSSDWHINDAERTTQPRNPLSGISHLLPPLPDLDYNPTSVYSEYESPIPPAPPSSSVRPQLYHGPISVAKNPTYAHQTQIRGRPSSLDDPSEGRHMAGAQQSQSSVSRGPSIGTSSTMKHAGSLFRDFDGIHYTGAASGPSEGDVLNGEDAEEVNYLEDTETSPDDAMIDEIRLAYEVAARNINLEPKEKMADEELPSERFDILPSQPHNLKGIEPLPAENMVYYPAPVPLKLNRPQRLSQLPAPSISAQRRSQVLGSIPVNARQSVVWLSATNNEEERTEQGGKAREPGQNRAKQRQSTLNLQKLPPQLRASVFFDQQSVPHQVQVKQGSAVATLDSLLDASAKAPPIHSVEDTVGIALANLKHQRVRSSSSSILLGSKGDTRRSRMSLLPMKHQSSEKLVQLRKRASSALGLTSYDYEPVENNEQGEEDEEDGDEGYSDDEATPLADHSSVVSYDFEQEDWDDELEPSNVTDEDTPQDQEYAAPTTLLAELQLRKHELRSRNKTAATAFPDGMHSTLLELDAVAQIEKKKRQGQRTALAWEDPNTIVAAKEDADDDDVPLAMLYPTNNKSGGIDWANPHGLLAKRDMEESEPLSKRRNRLKGMNPNAANSVQSRNDTADDDDSEHEGETLAQRTRRLKSTKALNDAIGSSKGKQPGDDFANDVMSRFGGLDEAQRLKNGETTSKTVQESSTEEETLGQRKKRLQARAGHDLSGEMAHTVALNSIGAMRQISNESRTYILFDQSEQHRVQRRAQMSQQNTLGSSNLPDGSRINTNQFPGGQRKASGLLETSVQTMESRRQYIQNTNQFSATSGLEAPLIEHQAFVGQKSKLSGLIGQNDPRQKIAGFNGQAEPRPPFSASQQSLQPTESYTGLLYTDGTRGTVQSRASGFPHLQIQSSLQTRGFASSGFGMSPQTNLTPNGPQSRALSGGPMMQALEIPEVPLQHLQSPDEESQNSKQRDNIDRWRQSVMP